jgi:hypothetical protein
MEMDNDSKRLPAAAIWLSAFDFFLILITSGVIRVSITTLYQGFALYQQQFDAFFPFLISLSVILVIIELVLVAIRLFSVLYRDEKAFARIRLLSNVILAIEISQVVILAYPVLFYHTSSSNLPYLLMTLSMAFVARNYYTHSHRFLIYIQHYNRSDYQQFGGWLNAFVFMEFILAVPALLEGSLLVWALPISQLTSSSNFYQNTTAILVLQLATFITLGGLFVTIRIFISLRYRKAWAVDRIRFLLNLRLLIQSVVLLAMVATLQEKIPAVQAGVLVFVFRLALPAGIWNIYFLKSRRVEAYFCKGEDNGDEDLDEPKDRELESE